MKMKIFELAQSEALKRGHQQIDVWHLLYALISQKEGIVSPVLEKIPTQPSAMELAAARELERLPSVSGGSGRSQLYAAQAIQDVIAKAEEFADYLLSRDWACAYYHAGLEPNEKKDIQDNFQRGELRVITATNAFITRPIAELLGVQELIACEGEIVDGRYTGEPRGVPSYHAGKVTRLKAWLAQRDTSLDGAFFYSDSHNDLPLLELVDNPVAVDPDEKLLARAQEMGWPVISLRN